MGTMESGEEVISGASEERIYVSVRIRPLNGKELLRHDVSDWDCINDRTIVYKNVSLCASERSMYPSAYTFDKVFRSSSSTREVYEQGAKDVAISVVSGFNSSVFAYGQTSSGKTYTMTGITEYAFADIYGYIEKHPEREFVLKFSAMEIYNESVRDLLSLDNTPLRLLDDPERGTIVEKLTEEILRDWDHVLELLGVCEAQRQIGETTLNEVSSRSHQIIRLTIDSSSREYLGRDHANTLSASVNFVDLAGSERASQTLSAGTRLKEGCHINRSLLTLGTVIRKLSKGRNGHIPYRDSKLTRILQTSLSGNARTAIICTMSPARSHVEQSRNTLLFASCAKEVATNAQVNIVMSDKAMVKHLQRELDRLESQLKSPQSTVAQSNFSAMLIEKDLKIEKLETEIKELIRQRDIAQAQVRGMAQMLEDDASSVIRVGLGQYPHLRVQVSPADQTPQHETSIVADPHSLDVDTRTFSEGHSRTSSEDHFAKIPYFDEKFVPGYASPRILLPSSNFSDSDSGHGWEEIEKQSNGTSDEICRVVRCIEMEESGNQSATESSSLVSQENTTYPEVRAPYSESPSPSLKHDDEMKEEIGSVRVAIEDQTFVSASPKDERETILPPCEKETDLSSIDFLDIPSLEKLSLARDQSSRFSKSKSCKASIFVDSASPHIRMLDYSENTSVGSEREAASFRREFLSPVKYGSDDKSLSCKDSEFTADNALDIEVDNPKVKFSMSEDTNVSNDGVKEMTEPAPEKERIDDLEKENEQKPSNYPKKNVKDVGLDPIEDEYRGLSSWPVEFKRIQKEIVELWHACHVSLVHRTYFFLLFQGDPSDAIYLEVELRRIKFLKDKFSKGERTIVNGNQVTLASSEKALRHERRMMSKQMTKKLSEQERESLYLKWGIGLNTKLRRLQLAHRLWTNDQDINHISDSAFLVAKLVGFIEPGKTPDKEMFGLNFTPRSSTNTYSFKRSLISLI